MNSPVTDSMRLNKRLSEDTTPESIVDFGNDYLEQIKANDRIERDQKSTLIALDACLNAGVPLVLLHTFVKDPEKDSFVG